MSGFSAINLAELPAPQAVEVLSHAEYEAALIADLLADAPEYAPALALPSEPLRRALRALAYRELVWRASKNHSVRAVFLATATGADLDHRAAGRGIVRRVADGVAPEDDESLRARAALAPEGYSVAGPRGAYQFFAREAHPDVADVHVERPARGQVRVTVLGAAGDGSPSAAVLAAVTAALSEEAGVRPGGDQVTVAPATIVPYDVVAELILQPGPDAGLVLDAAAAAVTAYASTRARLGRPLAPEAIVAGLMRPGVVALDFASPGYAGGLAVGPREAASMASLTLTSRVAA